MLFLLFLVCLVGLDYSRDEGNGFCKVDVHVVIKTLSGYQDKLR